MVDHIDNCGVDNGTYSFKYYRKCTEQESAFSPFHFSTHNQDGFQVYVGEAAIIDMIARISTIYEWVMGLADERVSDWPLMSGPGPTILITIVYVFICMCPKGVRVRYLGLCGGGNQDVTYSRILQILLITYNAVVILLNTYIVIRLWEPCRVYQIECHPGM